MSYGFAFWEFATTSSSWKAIRLIRLSEGIVKHLPQGITKKLLISEFTATIRVGMTRAFA